MKKVKLLFVVLFLSAIAFTSCGKYDEGPSLSLRTKKARITGEWQIVKQQFNGVDVALDAEDKSMMVEFTKDDKYIMTTPYGSINGTWAFNSDKTKVVINITAYGQTYSSDATIMRLTNKELILEEMDEGDKTRMEFEKK